MFFSPQVHSLKKLLDELADIDKAAHEQYRLLHREALVLDRYYIPTRYPNGLQDITPDMAFEDADAALCMEYAQKIVALIMGMIEY